MSTCPAHLAPCASASSSISRSDRKELLLYAIDARLSVGAPHTSMCLALSSMKVPLTAGLLNAWLLAVSPTKVQSKMLLLTAGLLTVGLLALTAASSLIKTEGSLQVVKAAVPSWRRSNRGTLIRASAVLRSAKQSSILISRSTIICICSISHMLGVNELVSRTGGGSETGCGDMGIWMIVMVVVVVVSLFVT